MSGSQELIIVLASLLVSLSVHETMHGVASFLLGDETAAKEGRISLNPLDHIDPYLTVVMPVLSWVVFGAIFAIAKPVRVNFSRLRWGDYGGALVGAAGPASNLVLALLGAALYHLATPAIGSLAYNIITIFTDLNIALVVVNLIPWPPLDGSRILFAFAPEPLQEVMRSIEYSGILTLLFFLVIFYSAIGNAVFRLVGSLMASLGVPMPML